MTIRSARFAERNATICRVIAVLPPQAGARHRGPELAPDHENLRNPGYWAADKLRRSGADSLGLLQCLHDAITHFRRA